MTRPSMAKSKSQKSHASNGYVAVTAPGGHQNLPGAGSGHGVLSKDSPDYVNNYNNTSHHSPSTNTTNGTVKSSYKQQLAAPLPANSRNDETKAYFPVPSQSEKQGLLAQGKPMTNGILGQLPNKIGRRLQPPRYDSIPPSSDAQRQRQLQQQPEN